VRLAISVEGLTEERFVAMLLVPYLATKGIYVQAVNMNGDIYLPRIKKELTLLARSFDWVSTLYDFYGFRAKEDCDKAMLEKAIHQSLPLALQGKVIPYVQMYEFEGLLFSSPQAIEDAIGKKGLKDWAEGVLQAFDGNPESINDSPKTAPSKRLLAQASYIKSIHGSQIAADIGLTCLRQQCLAFNHWVSCLESLARNNHTFGDHDE